MYKQHINIHIQRKRYVYINIYIYMYIDINFLIFLVLGKRAGRGDPRAGPSWLIFHKLSLEGFLFG